jgi:hypothetical protein
MGAPGFAVSWRTASDDNERLLGGLGCLVDLLTNPSGLPLSEQAHNPKRIAAGTPIKKDFLGMFMNCLL